MQSGEASWRRKHQHWVLKHEQESLPVGKRGGGRDLPARGTLSVHGHGQDSRGYGTILGGRV